ncbi:MAG: ribonuclease J [Pseudomonadota bacterium]|nr:MAG: MBL fold metallo-hydrolase [Pseudomonadota bacterium]
MTDMWRAGSRPGSSEDEIVFLGLGGLGEIGLNVYLYGMGLEDNRRWLMVDLGLTFAEEHEPGVEIVLPDLRFIEEERGALEGIVLTHAHEDHFGAVIDLWDRLRAPIYATPFTAAMLRSKLAEESSGIEPPITVVPMGARFKVGPFDLEFVTMAHSIPEPSGLVIRTPHGIIFHTGDWKLDRTPLVGEPTDEEKIRSLGREGVRALICDSTNAFREGRSPSEADVAESLKAIIAKAKRRVAVTTFASNVARIRAIAEAAKATRRHLVVAGRAMHRVIQVAMETGYLPQDFRYLDQDQFAYLEPDEVLMLCTGSQGEPRAALSRIAEGEHPDLRLGQGDLVIFSSRTIPGNEKAVTRVQNNLALLGVDILTDADALVHVTGHPRREELKEMYAWLKPAVAVPMHGEARHLREHAWLAKAAGVLDVHPLRNGQMIRLAPDPVAIIDEAPVGRLYRDGRLIVSGEGSVRERRRLAFAGIVAIGMAMSRRGELLSDPSIAMEGIPAETADGMPMTEVVFDAIDGTLRSIPAGKRRDIELVRDAVRRSVRAAIEQVWGKKPIAKVLINVVDTRR